MAVPVLVSKALELFLQDLCDRTYEITIKRGAKTAFQSIQSFNVFDFDTVTVSRVPDLGGSEASADDRPASKKRRVSEDKDNGSDDESKRIHVPETGHTSTGGRIRGRGRVRGQGRGSHTLERESSANYENFEEDPDVSFQSDEKQNGNLENPVNFAGPADTSSMGGKNADMTDRNFDLNVDLNENGNSTAVLAGVPSNSVSNPALEMKHEEIPGWSLDEVEGLMAIDPIQLASINRRIDEEEEDYDEEED